MTQFERLGVLAHPQRPQSFAVAQDIAARLHARGATAWVRHEWDEATVRDLCQTSDLIIAIGGDGAMLRAVRATAPYGVPVLGVNMGYLGFLAEVENAGQIDAALEAVLSGGSWVETRMMVRATVLRAGQPLATGDALNDVVINRADALGTVLLQTYIDGDWATTYHADGVIIATATGSTAYALASGGPILPPDLNNILIVPVAPHLSMDRPIVLAEGARVDIVNSPQRSHTAAVILDGSVLCQIQPDDIVRVQASPHVGRFVRVRERNYFYRSLLDRLEPRLSVKSAPLRLRLEEETE